VAEEAVEAAVAAVDRQAATASDAFAFDLIFHT
jgi:phosphoribosyl-ATP pyrophosphohydrolase